MKSKIQRAERQAYWQHVEEVFDPDIDDRPGKQKRFWSFIKSPKKDNSGIASVKDRGKMHADPVDKANILNHQYESVYTREDEGDIPCIDGQPYPPMPDITVTKEGMEKLLKKQSLWTYQLGYYVTWPKRFLQFSLPYSRGP